MIDHARSWGDMVPHLATLSAYAAKSQVIVELGVRGCVSTWALLDGLPTDGQLVSVDIAEPTIPHAIAGDPRWTFLLGDDRDGETQAQLPIADLVFIDTSHEYHHTLDELALAKRLDARLILLHDWNLPDVADAVRGFVDRTTYRIGLIEPSAWGLVGLWR